MPPNAFAELFDDFLFDAHERIDRTEQVLLGLKDVPVETRRGQLQGAVREMHTLKGNAGMMRLTAIQRAAHGIESRLQELDSTEPTVDPILADLDAVRALLEHPAHDGNPSADSGNSDDGTGTGRLRTGSKDSIRVGFAALDEVVDLLSEMVIFRNRLADAIEAGRRDGANADPWDEIETAHEALGKTLSGVQDRVLQMRMVPLSTLFGQLRRIVHDESGHTDKPVRFLAEGGETPMDKALLEVAGEALGHLVRNAVIHGIEPAPTRAARHKAACGQVWLSANSHANEVQLRVEDDGGGVDVDALRAAASRTGLTLPGDDLQTLLFQPGLSSRPDADMSAGRGMGLPAALKAVQQMGGRIDVASHPGAGTRFRIHLPLSVSISRALLVKVDAETFAVPMAAVVESLKSEQLIGHRMDATPVLEWRSQVIPVVDLGLQLGTADSAHKRPYLIIIEADGCHRALAVDDITGIREVVVKRLDAVLDSPAGLSGATILGDGRVVLILDPAGLLAARPETAEAA